MVGIGARPVPRGPRRADVHLIDFPDADGHVIRGPHPAVIVSSDRLNRPTGTVLLCLLTSKIRHDPAIYLPPYLVTVGARSSGLDRDGYIKVDQVFTRPAETLGPRIGRIDRETVDRLDAALRFVVAL
ncbi:MAG: type II toxin-antitoxin system PemK/MazF family toxin [Candidatus Limnocylindrales bacterium]